VESSSGHGVSAPPRCILVYDADCGPCSQFKAVVGFLDLGRRLDYLSIASAEGSGLLDGVPPARRHSSFHLVQPGRRTVSGAEAIPSLVGFLPAGGLVSKILVSAPGVPGIVSFAYAAASRLHGRGACRGPTRDAEALC